MAHLRLLLLTSVLLSASVEAILRAPRHTVSVTQLTSEHAQAVAEWTAVTRDLWASLVIRSSNSSDSSNASGPPDFEAGDAETKKTFVGHCVVVFNVSKQGHLQEDVVQDMCTQAKGTAAECETMVSGLQKAFNASDLEPWCMETYDFFEAKTKPKCLSKCRALLCKGRCDANDKLRDLNDEYAAYDFKLDQTVSRQTKLNATRSDLESAAAEIETYNKTNVTSALDQVKKLTPILKDLVAKISTTQKDFSDTKDAKEAARKDLLAKRQDNGTSDNATIAAAEKAVENATEAFNVAAKEKTKLNSDLKDTQALLNKASAKYEYRLKRMTEMQEEHDVMNAKIDSDYDEAEKRRAAIVETLAAITKEQKVIEDALSEQLVKLPLKF